MTITKEERTRIREFVVQNRPHVNHLPHIHLDDLLETDAWDDWIRRAALVLDEANAELGEQRLAGVAAVLGLYCLLSPKELCLGVGAGADWDVLFDTGTPPFVMLFPDDRGAQLGSIISDCPLPNRAGWSGHPRQLFSSDTGGADERERWHLHVK